MPSCSVIIPVYQWASVTRQCLNILLASPPEVGTEIIVVDDGSADLTPQLLRSYGDRIQVVTHAYNLGFATACNDGASVASGDYLVFLNNDTLPQDGWLDALVEYAEAHDRAGVVGCKLLYPNDTIQHAGVVVCHDRFSRNIYAGLPQDHPVVNTSRRFQAVCGACMLVRRTAFTEVGGFDTGFMNAYEDHDLCFRLGELGYESHYCHTSVVYHLEKVTRRTRTEDFALSTARFRQRWAHRLEPDDLTYLVRDGMIQVVYDETYPFRFDVSPLVGLMIGEERALRGDRLLAWRAKQVQELMIENARLRAQVLEAAVAQQSSTPVLEAAPDLPSTTEQPIERDGPLDLTPPEHLVRMVGGEFRSTGQEFLQYFMILGKLQPSEVVLDVGCGAGRMAVPLTGFLSGSGSYAGFDISREAIDWCTREITTRRPDFQFGFADVFNTFYNPTGSLQAARFQFPYPDEAFDFVFVTSVFTHMLPDGVERYVSEIARVLKKEGRCFVTCLLLNDESIGLIRAGLADSFTFKEERAGHQQRAVYAALYPDVPEAAVAYQESYMRALFRQHHLVISDPLRYGRWCGRLDGMSLHDILVGVKQPEPAAHQADSASGVQSEPPHIESVG